MEEVKIGGAYVNMAWAILSANIENEYSRPDCIVANIFDRSQQVVAGAVSGMNRGFVKGYTTISSYCRDFYSGKIVNLRYGKERVSNAIAFSPLIRLKKAFVIRKGTEVESFYSYIMRNTPVPVTKEICSPLLDYLVEHKMVGFGTTIYGVTEEEAEEWTYELSDGSKCKLSHVAVMRVSEQLTEEYIAECLKQLYLSGTVRLTNKPQKPFEVKSIDEYFEKYGQGLINEVDEIIKPTIGLEGSSEEYALKAIRPYPQQNAIANGAVAGLKDHDFMFLNCGMGVGKTILSLISLEIREVRKYMSMHKGATLQDAYLDANNINYRSIIMCPGHLVEKWAKEIRNNIPYAKVKIIRDLADATAIKAKGSARNGREFYVIGKDTAKLSYSYRPSVGKITRRRVPEQYVCAECGAVKTLPGAVPCACGANHWIVETRFECSKCGRKKGEEETGACECGGNWLRKPISVGGRMASGCTCPECDNLLWEYKEKHNFSEEIPLQPEDFAKKTSANSNCYVCGAPLWAPHVSNLGKEDSSNWYRVKYYHDKKMTSERIAWCYRGRESEFEATYAPINSVAKVNLSRKVSPSNYMKRQLKGFFDYLIADECHLYKGGGTGQGQAFGDLVCISKKQLLLTGTLLNGYATALFYLLYRVAPWLMKKRGYEWTDEMKFAKTYGVVKQEFSKEGDDIYLQNCRGKSVGTVSVKPGCSPLVIKDLLLPFQLCLDLSDMSRFLPPLIEKVVTVPLEPEILEEYHRVNKCLEKALKTDRGKKCMSDKLQFSLSYTDKPFGRGPIISGEDGEPLCEIANFEEYADTQAVISGYDKKGNPIWKSEDIKDFKLSNKEQRLIELVESELSEGRNVCVFAEYTASPMTNIADRLKKVLGKNVKGLREEEVVVLQSSSPSASKREEWIHKQARNGMRVMICNPRCVETGLDFCFSEMDDFGNKVDYNYPSLIFFQCGYSYFTLAQASRRHYRLCQKEECRTYYFASEGTVQMDVLQIMAEKQVATQAIQGKFSEAGLAAMSKSVDVKVQLAQSLAGKTKIDAKALADMFDCSNRANAEMSETEKQMLANYKPQPTFEEIMGGLKYSDNIADEIKVVDMATLINSESMSVKMMDSIGEVLKGVEVSVSNDRHAVNGQLGLFALLGATSA